MSEKLGPVHYMMRRKMLQLEKMTRALLTPEERERVDSVFAPLSQGDLEDLVDQENIHGWLSSEIDRAEARFAYALYQNKKAEEILEDLGREERLSPLSDEEELLSALLPNLLDGMPCDHAAAFSSPGKGMLLYHILEDVHENYAQSPLAVDPSLSLEKTCEGNHDHDDHPAFHIQEGEAGNLTMTDFHRARLAYLRGLLQDSGYEVKPHEKGYLFTKKKA